MSKRHLIASAFCALLLTTASVVLPGQAGAGGFGRCTFDFDCNDFNFCTTDRCFVGSCAFLPINCDDGNFCTADSCQGFSGCVHTDVSCSDGSACTRDTCEPASGCVNPPDGCDDSNACTDDVCVDGSTCGHTDVDCDDGNACTDDVCDSQTGCGHMPVTTGACAGTPVAGTRLRVDDVGPPRGKRNAVTLTGPIDLTGLDPTVSGATAIIGVPGGASLAIDLPASGWSKRGTRSRADYKYKSDSGDGVLAARLRDGRSFRFSARGDGVYGLGGVAQGALGVFLVVGDGRFCAEFGGTIRVDDGSHFFAVRAPAPASCPDLDAR